MKVEIMQKVTNCIFLWKFTESLLKLDTVLIILWVNNAYNDSLPCHRNPILESFCDICKPMTRDQQWRCTRQKSAIYTEPNVGYSPPLQTGRQGYSWMIYEFFRCTNQKQNVYPLKYLETSCRIDIQCPQKTKIRVKVVV